MTAGYHRAVGFEGFDRDAPAFYAELRVHNTREWWARNRERYERRVLGPMRDLADELEPEFGEIKIFRPHRDVRFTADKSPYKLHIGMVTRRRVAHYLQLSEDGLLIGGGAYDVPPAALGRFRAAVDDDVAAAGLEELLSALASDGFTLMADAALRTAPRGFAPDHPRIELLRLKRLAVAHHEPPADWMFGPAAYDEVRHAWSTVSAWCVWLDELVGDLLTGR